MQTHVYLCSPIYISLRHPGDNKGTKPFQATYLFQTEREKWCIVKGRLRASKNLMNDVYGPHLYVEHAQVGMVAG